MNQATNALVYRFHNQFRYGMSEIYKRHANIDSNQILLGLFQHGVIQTRFMTGTRSELDVKAPRYIFKRARLYVFAKSTSYQLEQLHGIKSYAIGSPWIYLGNHARRTDNNDAQGRTIVFPPHTTPIDNFSYRESSIILRIKRWLEIVGGNAITISLFHSDYMDACWHSAARKFGAHQVRLFCAGVSESPSWSLQDKDRLNFLAKLKNEISRHDQALFETYESSALFYSLDLGLKVGVFNSKLSFDAFPQKEKEKITQFLQLTNALIPEKFRQQITSIFSTNQYTKEVAREYLGYSNKLSSEEMKSQLVCAKFFRLQK